MFIMFWSLVVCFTHLAPWVPCSCIAYASHMHTRCIFAPLMFELHFCLMFELHFLIHLAPIMHHTLAHIFFFFPSFLLIVLSIRDKKGESISESIQVCIVISIWLMCTLLGEVILSRAHSEGEKVIGKMHILRGRRHFSCLVLVYITLVP